MGAGSRCRPGGCGGKIAPVSAGLRVIRRDDGTYRLQYDEPKSIGYIAPFYGNFGVVLRAYAYLLLLGRDGLREASNNAVLNANYVQARLRGAYESVSDPFCMHECVFTGAPFGKFGIHTLDIAKGLIDRGIHPPTIYFPLNVPEAIMIEPTETESKATLDHFVEAMLELAALAESNPDSLHAAPISMPVGRLDEVAAAKNMNLVYEG